MSTKIYTGFRIKATSMIEIMRVVNNFRPWIIQQAEKVMDDFLAIADANKKDPNASSYLLWLDLRDKMKGQKFPAVDTDFGLSFIPTDGEYTLGICFCVHDEWFQEWLKQPGVEEYGYWNNTDRPDELTEEQWEAREQAWEILGSGPVSIQSFGIDFISSHGPMPKCWRKPDAP